VSGVTLEIALILLLIMANGLFAMSETAIVSSRKTRLEQRARQGDAKAGVALELANAPNRFLSTVQIGITLVGILAGAFGGATIAEQLAAYLRSFPRLAPFAEIIGLAIVVLGITYFSLILGELVPKRLALHNPEGIASAVARPVRWLSVIGSPAVWLLSASTEMVLRMFGAKPSTELPVTEEEVKLLIKQGTEAGTFERTESDIVERVFRLGDRALATLMTPRTEIVWIDIEESVEEIRTKVIGSTHTRIVVSQGTLDHVLGVAHTNDLLVRCLMGDPVQLKASLRHPLFLPESITGLKILELFKQSSTHIALVVDEHGGVQGLVTLNDIFEAMVGDIPSTQETSAAQPAIQREDGSWLLDGTMPLDDFKSLVQIESLRDEKSGYFHTLAGFVLSQLGRVPKPADHFECQGLRFEVMDMDGRRIDKVLVRPGQAKPASLANDR